MLRVSVVIRHLICIGMCVASSACASTQLNYNTADLASSLNSLAKKQIFYNLAQALEDPDFVPSQATISIGTAQTINSVTPSVSVPLAPPFATTTRFTSSANPSAQYGAQIGAISPTIGVSVTDAWNQSWTMVPANSSNQLRRLRTLYQYVTGTMPRRETGAELTQEEAEKRFLCDYPVQALSVSPTNDNVIFRLEGCNDNNPRAPRSLVIHADPTFTQGPNCVICIDDLNAKSLRPYVNPNLKYHFVHPAPEKTDDMVKVGSHGIMNFYVCGSTTGNCALAPHQEPFDGRMAFSDFVLFVYEAMASPSATGSGRSTSGGSFVYSVR